MQNVLEKSGDFSNIMEYFSRMLAVQQRRTFPLHDYTFTFLNHIVISDADSGKIVENESFPDKDNMDRIKTISFLVSGINMEFTLHIGWDSFKVSLKSGTLQFDKFVEMIDQSTFRFF
ncbi:MAG: hypothetical protein ACYCSO_09085 [Cuniculiplasma sp.]